MSERSHSPEHENSEESDYSIDELIKKEELFEFHTSFAESKIEDVVGRLEWLNIKEQAQLMLLCEKLGISEQNTLALSGFLAAIHQDRLTAVTTGLEVGDEKIDSTLHPMFRPFDAAVYDLTTPDPDDLEDLGYDAALVNGIFEMSEEGLIKGLEDLQSKWCEEADEEGLEDESDDEDAEEDY